MGEKTIGNSYRSRNRSPRDAAHDDDSLMAVNVIVAVLNLPQGIATSTERLVAVSLANRCQKSGSKAYPSVATIAKETALSDRAVQTALKSLTAKGLILP